MCVCVCMCIYVYVGDIPFFRQPIIPTAHWSDGLLFRRPIVPTAHYSDQLLAYKVYNIFTSVHKITLKTVSLVERWNPQSDKLAHFLSDTNTAPSLA